MTKVQCYCEAVEGRRKSLAAVDGFYRLQSARMKLSFGAVTLCHGKGMNIRFERELELDNMWSLNGAAPLCLADLNLEHDSRFVFFHIPEK
ncbi:unnamed protein product [Cladocopium goreaui]|uniref:Uncharacterized protein n=1 Tax=Cladocopium goreaui TaxID=2562237 RepID=A0A9P1BZH2_9DINO|nr:unnamed protein product [Cladocopium goreaui]